MPASTINTGSHPKLLWPGVHATWGQVYAEHKPEYTDLYTWDDSEQAYEEDLQVSGFGLASIKPEGSPGTYDSELQGILTRYVPTPYSLGYIVTHEELKDNLYDVVANRRAKANSFSINQTIENICAFVYNNGFVTTFFTTGDNQALFSTGHTQVTGGTFSNALTPAADLAETSLEDISIQIMGVQTDRGLFFSAMPESLHIHRNNWFNANRILKSVLQPGGSNNDINVLHATNAFPKGIKLNHYFTNPGAWFVRTNVPNGMHAFWRERPDLKMDNDFDTKNAKALCYFRLSVGCTDPRGAYGSNGP